MRDRLLVLLESQESLKLSPNAARDLLVATALERLTGGEMREFVLGEVVIPASGLGREGIELVATIHLIYLIKTMKGYPKQLVGRVMTLRDLGIFPSQVISAEHQLPIFNAV